MLLANLILALLIHNFLWLWHKSQRHSIVRRVNQGHSIVRRVNQSHSIVRRVNQAHSIVRRVNQGHSIVRRVNLGHNIVRRVNQGHSIVRRVILFLRNCMHILLCIKHFKSTWAFDHLSSMAVLTCSCSLSCLFWQTWRVTWLQSLSATTPTTAFPRPGSVMGTPTVLTVQMNGDVVSLPTFRTWHQFPSSSTLEERWPGMLKSTNTCHLWLRKESDLMQNVTWHPKRWGWIHMVFRWPFPSVCNLQLFSFSRQSKSYVKRDNNNNNNILYSSQREI